MVVAARVWGITYNRNYRRKYYKASNNIAVQL